jgi:hypothetical protein
MRPLAQILACILTGLGTGAGLMLLFHGYEPTLRLAHALLQYAYSGYSFAP